MFSYRKKTTMISIFIIIALQNVNGQNKSNIVDFYVDSLKVDFTKYFLNPYSIESILVGKDSGYIKNGGKVFIALKKGTIVKSINEIASNFINKTKGLIFSYKINEKEYIDTVGIKIDISSVVKTNIVQNANGKYTLEIETTALEQQKKQKQKEADALKAGNPIIHIRGQN